MREKRSLTISKEDKIAWSAASIGSQISCRGVQARCLSAWICGLMVACHLSAPVWGAPLTASQKKELSQIRGEITRVAGLISRKKYEEGEKLLDEVEQRLEGLIQDAGLEESDPQILPIKRLMELQRSNLLKNQPNQKETAEPVSFVKEIAPILSQRCVSCHSGNDPAGGLRLDTFAGLETGGRSGPVISPRNPQLSLLMARVLNPDPQQRMPRNAPALSPPDIKKLIQWILQGAAFDGNDKNLSLSMLVRRPELAKEKIVINKATGNETVSFVRDIAPTFVNTCGGCHGNQRSGGLSLATFEAVMIGGDSGRAIIPGDVEGSLLFQKLRDGEMPRGNMTGITRKFYADLQTWIREGARYDGSDPKTPLRQLIPTPEQLLIEALSKLTPEGWLEKRQREATELWQLTFSESHEPARHTTPDLLLLGDVSPNRLQEIGHYAQQQVEHLKTLFPVKDSPVWKGRLIVFVFKDRFGYEEFNNTVHRREIPRDVCGHSEVTTGQDRAFVAVQDIGDQASAQSPGMLLNVAEHITGAFIRREGGNYPDWFLRGLGLVVAHTNDKDAASDGYLRSLRGRAIQAIRETNLSDPAGVFQDGQFSPAEMGAVGYTLIDFLVKHGGTARVLQLMKRFQARDSVETALQTVYQVPARQLGAQYLQSLSLGATGTRKGK